MLRRFVVPLVVFGVQLNVAAPRYCDPSGCFLATRMAASEKFERLSWVESGWSRFHKCRANRMIVQGATIGATYIEMYRSAPNCECPPPAAGGARQVDGLYRRVRLNAMLERALYPFDHFEVAHDVVSAKVRETHNSKSIRNNEITTCPPPMSGRER